MIIGNIGKSKSSESLPPEEDNQIIFEPLEDIEVTDFEENERRQEAEGRRID
jgi:hypothetical protein